MRIPLVKLFNLCTGKYFYDVGKNTIIKVDDETYKVIQYICKYGLDDFYKYNQFDSHAKETVLNYIKKGYLSCNQLHVICHPCSYVAHEYLEKKLHGALIQITQMCNFRCRYCPYSGNGYFDRKHINKTITFEMACDIVDFVMKRSKFSNYLDFGFYGGEPLIHFNLIKNIVSYIEKHSDGKSINYSLTTNGYFLNVEIIEFLIKHNVSLTVSLDGPEHIHNKNRRLAGNGMGTYRIIYENLSKIVRCYPQYVEKIGINAVWDMEEDYVLINDFFRNDPVLKNFNYAIGAVDSSSTGSTYSMVDENYSKQQTVKMLSLIDSLGINNNGFSNHDENAFKEYNDFKKRLVPHLLMPYECHHGGPCLPGYTRMFVDVEGNIFPCEKLSGNSKISQIGHINTGFNYDNIYQLLNIGKITEQECKNCWAFFFCSCCVKYVDNIDNLSREKKLHECTGIKSSVLKNMSEYIITTECKKIVDKEEICDLF